MSLYPVAGSKIFIGGVKSDQEDDFDASDFAAESWTEIDGWTQMGALGDSAALITTSLINRNRDIKQKGTKNAGSMQCVFAHIATDEGQIALIAASQANDNYAFRVDFTDGTKRYFVGLVMNAIEAGGEANTIRNLQSTIEINSNIVSVPAS
ncbi:MAG: hypothetical protein ACOY5F_04740 [Pseudomonadota bacterium]